MTITESSNKSTKEIFKDVPNYEGVYQVSNLGCVKSLKFGKERILLFKTDRYGYFGVSLWESGNHKYFNVHQLVVMAFYNHKPNGMKLVVNHKNFNKQDNSLGNLEVITTRENCNRKHIKSRSKYVGVALHSSGKKWISRIVYKGKREYLGLYEKEYNAHLAYQKRLKEIHHEQ